MVNVISKVHFDQQVHRASVERPDKMAETLLPCIQAGDKSICRVRGSIDPRNSGNRSSFLNTAFYLWKVWCKSRVVIKVLTKSNQL